MVESLEKLRDYITLETKKIKDDHFKYHFEMEGKLKEKLDKADVLEVESTVSHLTIIERLIGCVDLQINERTKKYVEKVEIQRLKKNFDQQIENLFSLM